MARALSIRAAATATTSHESWARKAGRSTRSPNPSPTMPMPTRTVIPARPDSAANPLDAHAAACLRRPEIPHVDHGLPRGVEAAVVLVRRAQHEDIAAAHHLLE